jgi:cystathionine beta-synthase
MRGKNVLVILPDSGNRYLSKVFNDDWMREAGFLERPSLGNVSDLMHAIKPKSESLVMVKQNEKISAVIELMKERGISQVPVADDAGWIKGIVNEGAILTALYDGRAATTDTVEALANPAVEFVTLDDPVEKVSRLLATGKVALVSDKSTGGKLLGIITKIDLLTYLGAGK